ncbi:hypothetical protein WJX72_006421 [[Myrmecia] bisecta]|uniref:Uncharacterized protein n=1 Tax=[Myrmecia] bisecta TaxID=41462 RepID=A0AAW1QBQ7_9CHLO
MTAEEFKELIGDKHDHSVLLNYMAAVRMNPDVKANHNVLITGKKCFAYMRKIKKGGVVREEWTNFDRDPLLLQVIRSDATHLSTHIGTPESGPMRELRAHARDCGANNVPAEWWEPAVHVDIDPATRPDLVMDLTLPQSLMVQRELAGKFDYIVGVALPAPVMVDTFGLPRKTFWSNVRSWLRPGGTFVCTAPRDLVLNDPLTDYGAQLAPRSVKLDGVVCKVLCELADPSIAPINRGYSDAAAETARIVDLCGRPYAAFVDWLRRRKPPDDSDDPKPDRTRRLASVRCQVERITRGSLKPVESTLVHSSRTPFCFAKTSKQRAASAG